MTDRLKAIVRQADGEYSVSLESTDDSSVKTFMFRVGKDELEVVSCDHAFSAYMGMAMQHATALYAAVHSFHRAQAIEVP